MANAPLHLFGVLAVRHGILRSEQLHILVQEQKQDDTPIGELARRKGLMTARQIRYLLDVQKAGVVDPAATTFGALLVHNGFASPDEVGIALQAQKSAESGQPPPPLGEILVGMGTLDQQQSGAILQAQRRLRGAEECAEMDFETRVLPAVTGHTPVPGPRAEPQGWLIQETGDDLGTLFPLQNRSVIGRLAEQDVPVPDMAASRDHAVIEYSAALLRHVITDLDSRNGTFLNGAQLIRPHPLQPGDTIQIGTTILRYVTGGGIGGGNTTIVSRLGDNAARTARDVASRAMPLLRGAASAAGETARRLLATRRHRLENLLGERDSLLEQLGRAAIHATPEAGSSLTVQLAQRKLDELRRGGDPAVVRWAERRQTESVRQLGRTVVDRGPSPEGWMPVIVAIRELDAEVIAIEHLEGEPSHAG